MNIFRWQSLNTRVTLFTLAIFLTGIWSLAYYASRMLRDDMQRLLSDQQFSTVSFIAEEMNDELGDRQHALEKAASLVTPATMSNPDAIQAFIEQSQILQEPFNAGVVAIGRDGTAIASVPKSIGVVGVNLMDRDHVVAALTQGRATISRPVMGKKVLSPIFVMATPVRDAQGKVIGALTGLTDLSKPNFLEKVTEGHYGKTGGYVLVAPQHRLIVTATDKRLVMTPVPKPGADALIDRFMSGYEGSGVLVNSVGAELFSSAKRVPRAGWYVAAVLPTNEAFAPIEDMQRRMLLMTVFLTMLAGGLTWLMLRRQLAPMLGAVKTLSALSDADQTPQALPVTSNDEVGELIGGFNRLLKTLAKREAALKESEQRLEWALSAGNNAMWDWDLRTGIAYLSPQYYEITGHLPGTITPDFEFFKRLVHPDDLPGVEKSIDAHMRGETPVCEFDFRMITRSSEIKWARGSGRVVKRGPDGAPLRMVGTIVDITGRKGAEAEHELLEAKLRESQKMEALGTMAGGVAHDFNNALAMIIGNTELARQDVGQDHAALVSLDEIGKASRRAKDLVQQILAFGRRQKLQREPTTLALVVVESARLIRATLPVGVTLNVNCKADAPAVLADATQIKQILLNLCGNAAHAIQNLGRPGAIEVELRAHVCEAGDAHADLPPGRYACLTVRDNGEGMDEATRSRMFEPFFTTKPVGKGTGLGLAVVHGIVQTHEAHLEVKSTPGAGSEFRVYFPAIDAPAVDTTATAPATATVHGAGKHILYVDDEEAIIFLVTRLLERQGYRVSGFTDPAQALAAVRADPGQFDLAVTDYNMPGMTGLDVAIALREVRADLPVVLASGYITEELRQRAPAAGVRELIYKPNTVDDLCDAVARFANAHTVAGTVKPF